MAQAKNADLTHSLGMSVDKDGVATGILWNGPAFKADIINGTKIVAVDGLAYSRERIEAECRRRPTARRRCGCSSSAAGAIAISRSTITAGCVGRTSKKAAAVPTGSTGYWRRAGRFKQPFNPLVSSAVETPVVDRKSTRLNSSH